MRTASPAWAQWPDRSEDDAYTLGVEEEVMLVYPGSWSLAQAVEQVLERLPDDLRGHVFSETHSSAVELTSGVHSTVGDAVAELGSLRGALHQVLTEIGLTAACSGTHPFAFWHDMRVSGANRHQEVYGSMRALARREPTFALHVHVGLANPVSAVAAANQMRAHLPLLLALSANSPYWQGRDTGLASARTPLFQAFPRVGIPRAFESYAEYVETVDLLIRGGAFPDHTFLWWDVRLQPRFGTVEVRIMDAQATLGQTAALVALVQCLVRLEALEGYASSTMLRAQEVLDENRFLAARDGVDAEFIDPDRECRVPVRDLLDPLLDACAPHAEALGCTGELNLVRRLVEEPGAERQRRLAGEDDDQRRLVAALAEDFTPYPAHV
jgi:glutamate---cysteine ligase / carboxylate-amine ligase